MPSDVTAAILSQNTQVAAGEVGGVPQPDTQMLDAIVTAQSRLQTPDQFRNIIVKADPSGARVLLGDVARVELGAENYSVVDPGQRPSRRRHRHQPRRPAPTRSKPPSWSRPTVANLVETACRRAIEYAFAYDTTDFIKLSINEVVKTLVEAMFLVVLVMFVFLQSWRATIIPAIAIPVVLLGTFAMLYCARFFDQHHDPVRSGAGGRAAGRRRDRRGRECRADPRRTARADGHARRPSSRWTRSRWR